jgi:MFS family permease
MPFALLALLFGVFGGLAESLYAVGVAHANDRAVATDYVALSSTLLFVWALGSSIGPPIGTYALQLIAPGAFFVYVVVLTLIFTVFAVWRLSRRKAERLIESHEDFLAYPQTSPEIYAWLPYHKDTEHELEKTRAATATAAAPSATATAARAADRDATAADDGAQAADDGAQAADGGGKFS